MPERNVSRTPVNAPFRHERVEWYSIIKQELAEEAEE